MMTSRFITKSVRSLTPGSFSTSSIHVPLALANTSAVPSLWIWAARASEAPTLKLTVTPGLASSKAGPIASWNTAVSEEAAKTVSSVVSAGFGGGKSCRRGVIGGTRHRRWWQQQREQRFIEAAS